MSIKLQNHIKLLQDIISVTVDQDDKDYKELCEVLEREFDLKYYRKMRLDRVLNTRIGGPGGSTWFHSTPRCLGNIPANWLWKELRRSGDKSRNSERRCDLYHTRRDMLTTESFAYLLSNAQSHCRLTKRPLNFGLGENKILMDNYFQRTQGVNGVSPSLDRIDDKKGYSLDNVEIISSIENFARNQGVNTNKI
mgnify:FL=1